jgi:hypothetical protein
MRKEFPPSLSSALGMTVITNSPRAVNIERALDESGVYHLRRRPMRCRAEVQPEETP